MNLWRQLESKVTERSPNDRGHPPSPSLGPRIDVALEVSAVVARFILDPRLSFGLAIGSLIFVPTFKGRILAAGLVVLGGVLLYRSDRLGRISDHLRWLAWADLNKPLLRRLSLEAPGTYAHTIAMANLCETACNAIGARGLLARVGTYYHDIGKLRKPQHFVENQVRGRNPHDKLKPSTSAAIIAPLSPNTMVPSRSCSSWRRHVSAIAL
jgi:putative nucleotidyltransferase with HDIG domain